MLLFTGFRVVLGVIFCWAGLIKISDPSAFARIVKAYDILPPGLAVPFAVVVPWIEVIAGGCLIVGLWTRSNALVSGVLLCSFIVALAINIYRGADISCGCFGQDGYRGTLLMVLAQDLLLVVGSLALIVGRRTRYSLDCCFGQLYTAYTVDKHME